MAKKKKKRVYKIKNIIIILIGIVLLGAGGTYLVNLPIKNIYVLGNKIISDEEIMSLSSLDSYPSFLLTSGSNVKKSILINEYVKDIKLKKKWNFVVEVEVLEYEVVALDNDGMIILENGNKLNNLYNIMDVPKLVSVLDSEKLLEFASRFNYIDKNILREISEIEYSPSEVDDDRFLLYMNDGNLVYVTLTKVEKMNKYYDIKDELMDKKGIIYLDSGDYVELK